MKKREDILEEMDDFTPKGFTPTIIAGGGDDPNWLYRLPVGTIFTCRHNPVQGQRQAINEFEIVGKENNGDVKLYNELADVKIWVDSLEFSTAHVKRSILCDPNGN